MEKLCIYKGKVRDIFRMGDEYLLMKATDRVSSFDKHIGIIPGKGELLNKMSEFWFQNTRHIIDNHLVSTEGPYALVKKCVPFKIEVVVRGYITGNTSTSLWTHYQNGERTYCGITFPDGLKKHQKLPRAVITPTTKGKVDRPITKEEIVSQGYMSEAECGFVFRKALELFAYGQEVADKAGFILVDTKYEFGKALDGKIILIDEVHTCDSSRYWLRNTYEERIKEGKHPDKLDKDCVRYWIKSVCDPYKDPIPAIPEEIIETAYSNYKLFYDSISSVNMSTHILDTNKAVMILAGSHKDWWWVDKILKALEKNESNTTVAYHVMSAHKETQKVLDTIKKYDELYNELIWITVAGRSNALSGVVASNSNKPVIACPPFNNYTDMLVNLQSSVQCPSNVPVMTILEPGNVALVVKRIFNLGKKN